MAEINEKETGENPGSSGNNSPLIPVRLFSDGAARGNPDGPGGYGTILQYRDRSGTLREKEFSEGFPLTTNNRMELMGVITGLEALQLPCEVDVYSDSQYVVNAFEKGWIDTWRRNGWQTAGRQPVKNRELWERLLNAMKDHRVTFHWVRGHNGHPENERCDRLATAAADRCGENAVPEKKNIAKTQTTPGGQDLPEEQELPLAAGPSGQDELTLRIRYHADIDRLCYIGGKSDWIDLRAGEDVRMQAGEFRLISLGISVQIPSGYEMLIAPRSSTFRRWGILQTNSIGIVDESYCGDGDILCFPAYATRDCEIQKNERICQFRLLAHQPQIRFQEVESLGNADRGGFGSTGTV